MSSPPTPTAGTKAQEDSGPLSPLTVSTGWRNIGPEYLGKSTVATKGSLSVLFVRLPDNRIYYMSLSAGEDEEWQPPLNPIYVGRPGSDASRMPAAASDVSVAPIITRVELGRGGGITHEVNIFIRGPDNQVYTCSGAPGDWGKWRLLDGVRAQGNIGVHGTAAGAIFVVVREASGGIRFRERSSAGVWDDDWTDLAYRVLGSPAIVYHAALNEVNVFVRGNDNHIKTKKRDAAGVWDALWTDLGGQAVSNPVTVERGPTVEVFMVGPDNKVYRKYKVGGVWTPSLLDWEDVGGRVASPEDPVVVAWDTDPDPGRTSWNVEVFVQWNEGNNVRYRTWKEATLWDPWRSLAGATREGLAVPTVPSQISEPRVLAKGSDGSLLEYRA